MPVGKDHPVKRFVKGHIYKLYKPETPDRYCILRFKEKTPGILQGTYGRSQGWWFKLIADNLSDHRRNPVRGLGSETISKLTVEKVTIEDLPRYVSAKYVAPEFERVMKGEPIYQRKFSKLHKSDS